MLRYTFTEQRWAEKFAIGINDAFSFTACRIDREPSTGNVDGYFTVQVSVNTDRQREAVNHFAAGFQVALSFAARISNSVHQNRIVA